MTPSLFASSQHKVNKAVDVKAEKYYKQLTQLNDKQFVILVKSIKHGEKYNKGEKLGAIAWRESNLGKYVANPKEGKYGTYGVYQSTVEADRPKHNMKHTLANVKKMRQLLLNDLMFAANDALTELKYWESCYKDKKNKDKVVLASYNAGTKGIKSSNALAYADDVMLRTKVINKYVEQNKQYITARYNTIVAKEYTKLALTVLTPTSLIA